MAVKLRKRKNKDGTTSLLLDIYHEGNRSYEFLKQLKLSKPSTPAEREANKKSLELAQKIAAKRAHELEAADYNIPTETGKNTIVVDWMQSYVDRYKKKDKRNMQGVLNRFKQFLIEEKKSGLTFGRITASIVSDFQDYLREHSKGEGAASYFNRFKKMMKQAKRDRLIIDNPAAEVKTIGAAAKKKDILTLEEIQTLANTPTDGAEVKRAFLFSCVTGLRWIDVYNLTWENINLQAGYMSVKQAKTEREIRINLNDTARKILGKADKDTAKVFDLPTANGCNKTLKLWVKRAGIKKKITWHNARHSFGTNLIFWGTDLVTASALLGHASLKHTQRYVQAANELKERATDKLNFKL
jgi:integrase/recombinase XerD